MKLHPFMECVEAAVKILESGGTVFQEFNCSGCGAKQIMGEPNRFYKTATCEECGHVTDIEKDGCNYLVIF